MCITGDEPSYSKSENGKQKRNDLIISDFNFPIVSLMQNIQHSFS